MKYEWLVKLYAHTKKRVELKKIIFDITEALHKQSLDGYLDGFHEEVIIAPQRVQLLDGIEPWRKFMEKALPTIVSVKYDKMFVKVSQSCDWGYCVADFKVVEKRPQGEVEVYEKLHATLMKSNNIWKIVAFSLTN